MKAVIDFKKLLLSGEAKTNDWLNLKTRRIRRLQQPPNTLKIIHLRS